MKDTKNAFTPARDATPALRQTVAGRDPGKRRLAIRLVRYRDATPGDTATNYDVKPPPEKPAWHGHIPVTSVIIRPENMPAGHLGHFRDVRPSTPAPYPTANAAAALTRQAGFIQYPDISAAPDTATSGETGHPAQTTPIPKRQATAP